jgi:hypothetical protein
LGANSHVAIAIALFPRFVRLARSATQVVRREPFIDASIASGRGPFAIMAHLRALRGNAMAMIYQDSYDHTEPGVQNATSADDNSPYPA